jgi:hypothetical protein
MQSMQERVLEAIEHDLKVVGCDAVQKADYSNTGRIYGMKGLRSYVDIAYDFQSDYCTITITSETLAGVTDHPPMYRAQVGAGGAPKADTVSFLALKYVDADRIQVMLEFVRRAARRTRVRAQGVV